MYFFLHPLFWVITATLLIYYFGGTRKKMWYIMLAISAYLLSIPIVPKYFVRSWEFRYPAQAQIDERRTYHILVLGAGKNDDQRLQANQRLEPVPLARLVEGVKWFHRLEDALLIGSGPQGCGDLSQANIMQQTAILLGVPPEKTAIQADVVNTRTEAQAYVDRYGTDTPLILCTSALHIPRALAWMKAYGVKEVIPAPAHYLAPREPSLRMKDFLPGLSQLDLWQQYAKERLGMWEVEIWKGRRKSQGKEDKR